MTMINASDPASSGNLPAHEQEMIARRRRLLGPAYRLFYAEPVHVVRGEGVWLYDQEGRAYLDAYNNVASVGHCHPHVVGGLVATGGRHSIPIPGICTNPFSTTQSGCLDISLPHSAT